MTDSLFKNSFIYYHTGFFPLLQDVKLFSLFCMFFPENLSPYCAKAWTYF